MDSRARALLGGAGALMGATEADRRGSEKVAVEGEWEEHFVEGAWEEHFAVAN
jgi:hypothetical protein